MMTRSRRIGRLFAAAVEKDCQAAFALLYLALGLRLHVRAQNVHDAVATALEATGHDRTLLESLDDARYDAAVARAHHAGQAALGGSGGHRGHHSRIRRAAASQPRPAHLRRQRGTALTCSSGTCRVRGETTWRAHRRRPRHHPAGPVVPRSRRHPPAGTRATSSPHLVPLTRRASGRSLAQYPASRRRKPAKPSARPTRALEAIASIGAAVTVRSGAFGVCVNGDAASNQSGQSKASAKSKATAQ